MRHHKKNFTRLHTVQNYQMHKGQHKHFKRLILRKERWFFHDQNRPNENVTEENSSTRSLTTSIDFKQAFFDAFYESNELKKPIIRDFFTQQNFITSEENSENVMPITTGKRLFEHKPVEGSPTKCVWENVNADIYLQQTTFDNSSTSIINSASPQSTIEFIAWTPNQSFQIDDNINSAALEHPLTNFDNLSADPYIIIDLNGIPISSKEFQKIVPISQRFL